MTESEQKWDEWMLGLIARLVVVATSDRANALRREDVNAINDAARELDVHRCSYTHKANMCGVENELKEARAEIGRLREMMKPFADL